MFNVYYLHFKCQCFSTGFNWCRWTPTKNRLCDLNQSNPWQVWKYHGIQLNYQYLAPAPHSYLTPRVLGVEEGGVVVNVMGMCGSRKFWSRGYKSCDKLHVMEVEKSPLSREIINLDSLRCYFLHNGKENVLNFSDEGGIATPPPPPPPPPLALP